MTGPIQPGGAGLTQVPEHTAPELLELLELAEELELLDPAEELELLEPVELL